MEDAVLAVLFLALSGLTGMVTVTGLRGRVTSSEKGYTIPETVRRNAVLTTRANRLVAGWCGAATILALVPAVVFGLAAISVLSFEVSTPWLVAVVVYGVAVTIIARYPFEKIERM